MADGRRLERRRRDEREQPRHLRERLGRRLQRVLDLAARHRRGRAGRTAGRGSSRSSSAVGVEPVAALGRDAAGGRVRMREQPERLELGELGADGRRRERERRALDEALRADGLARLRRTSSTTRRRMSCWRSVRLDFHRLQVFYGASIVVEAGSRSAAWHEPCVDRRLQASSSAVTPPPRNRPRCVSVSAAVHAARPGRAARGGRARAGSSAASRPASASGSSRRRPSRTPLALPRRRRRAARPRAAAARPLPSAAR